MYTMCMLENSNPNEESFSQLISLTEAAEISGFTDSYIRKLARSGKIWARKIGRNWVTTEDALNTYLAQERRTGPKSDP